MEVDSICGDPRSSSTQSIRATIDWKRIENKPTLDELTDEIRLESILLPRARHTGTVITLSNLRRPWTDKERVRFIAECRSFQVPVVLRNPLASRLIGRRAYAPAWDVWVLWEKGGSLLWYSPTGRESDIFCTIDRQDNSTSSGTSTP